MKLKVSLLLLVLALVAIWWAVLQIPDNNLHIYFCDVGQGDGALIIKGTTELVIDTGPDDKILSCLSAHIPFYDHTIEGVIVTHPQQDHMGGLINIAESYHLIQLFIPPAENNIRVYNQLLALYKSKKLKVSNLYTGDLLKFNGLVFSAIWPDRQFVDEHSQNNAQTLAWKTDGTDLNSFCIVGILSYGNLNVLFTGDADAPVEPAEETTGLLKPVEILKVPHHGSKTGMTDEWLSIVKPQIAVISVGKNNRYGHPTQEALDQLSKIGAKIYRTDQRGTIEISSDGKTYWLN